MGFLSDVASVLTFGVSDIVQGDRPFENLGEWSILPQLLLSIATGGIADVLYGIEKASHADGEWYDKLFTGIDRAIDPGGTVDYSFRKIGDELPEQWKPYLNTAGTVIGGVVGSYVPVLGNAAGAAIGSGVGSKLAGGTDSYDYTGDFIKAGMAYAGGKAGELATSYAPYTSTDYSSLGASPAYGGEVAKNSYLINGGTNATENLAQGITNNTLMAGTDATANLAQGAYTQPLVYGTSAAPTVAVNEGLMKPINENYWSDKVKALAEKKSKNLIKNQAKKYINEALGGSQTIQPITLSQVQMQSYKPKLNSFQNAENIQAQQEQALAKEATKTSDTQKTLEEQELERQGYLKKYLDYMYNKSGGRTQLLRDYLA